MADIEAQLLVELNKSLKRESLEKSTYYAYKLTSNLNLKLDDIYKDRNIIKITSDERIINQALRKCDHVIVLEDNTNIVLNFTQKKILFATNPASSEENQAFYDFVEEKLRAQEGFRNSKIVSNNNTSPVQIIFEDSNNAVQFQEYLYTQQFQEKKIDQLNLEDEDIKMSIEKSAQQYQKNKAILKATNQSMNQNGIMGAPPGIPTMSPQYMQLAMAQQQQYINQQNMQNYFFLQQSQLFNSGNFTHLYQPQDFSDLYIRKSRGGANNNNNNNRQQQQNQQNGQKNQKNGTKNQRKQQLHSGNDDPLQQAQQAQFAQYQMLQQQNLYGMYPGYQMNAQQQYAPNQNQRRNNHRGPNNNNNRKRSQDNNNNNNRNNNASNTNNNRQNNRKRSQDNKKDNNKNNNNRNNTNGVRDVSNSQQNQKGGKKEEYRQKKNRPRVNSEQFPVLHEKNEQGKVETVQYLEKAKKPIVSPADQPYVETRTKIEKKYSKFEIITSFERWKVDKNMAASLAKFIGDDEVPVVEATAISKLEVEQPFRKNSSAVTPLLKPCPQNVYRKGSAQQHYSSVSPNKKVRKFSSQK